MDYSFHYLLMAAQALFQRSVMAELNGSGLTAGQPKVLEFLSESDGVVTLLPACFDTIDSGEIKGAVVNGTRIDFTWRGGRVVAVSADRKIRIKNVNIAENAITENVELV